MPQSQSRSTRSDLVELVVLESAFAAGSGIIARKVVVGTTSYTTYAAAPHAGGAPAPTARNVVTYRSYKKGADGELQATTTSFALAPAASQLSPPSPERSTAAAAASTTPRRRELLLRSRLSVESEAAAVEAFPVTAAPPAPVATPPPTV